MHAKADIELLMNAGKLNEALILLDENITDQPGLAIWRYLRGKTYWRLGKRREAINDYEEAASLDPESPAVHALEMANDILDYYNPDLLNP